MKNLSSRKRKYLWWGVGIGGILLLVVAAPLIVIHFYQHRIKDYIVGELNKQFRGHTELRGFHVSPFVNFPYISVDLEGLSFSVNKGDSTPIYRFKDVYVGFDVIDLMKGQLNILQINLSSGFLNVVIDEEGKINLLEAKLSRDSVAEDETESPLNIDLKMIRLAEVELQLHNVEGDKFTHLKIEDAMGRFKFLDQTVDLRIDMQAALEEYRTGTTTLFRHKYFELHNDLSYFLARDFLEIRPGKLSLQNGTLDFSGSIDFADEVNLDLKLEGRKNSFDLFVSLAPEAVIEAMEKFSTRGDIYLKGIISGRSLHQNPHIEIELGCANTFFARKDSRKDVIKDLSFKGFFNTGDSNTLATSVFYLESLYGAPENSYIKGMFRVENFENPLINMDVHADIDLRYLPEFMPVDALSQSSGKVKIDITLQEFVTADSVLEVASQLDDGASSRVEFKNVNLTFKDYPHPIKDLNGSFRLDGDHLRAKAISARVANSDLTFSVEMDDLLHYFHGDDVPVAFKVKADAGKLVPGELVPPYYRPELDTLFAAVWRDEIYDFHAELDINTTSRTLDTFHYLPTAAIDFHDFRFRSKLYPNEIKEVKGHFDMNDRYIRLTDFLFHAGNSKMYGSAEIMPVAPLFVDSLRQWVNFKADVKSPYFNIKKLVSYDGRCLLNDQIEEEVIHQLDFKGHGRLLGNSFGKKGFTSELEIDRLLLRLNDFPLVERVSGKITTDTLGSVHIQNLMASVGKTDIRTSLDLEHYLDEDLKNKNIHGSFYSNWIDLDEIMGYQPAKEQATTTDSSHNVHQEAFNIFALAFPTMSLDLDIQHFRYHKYLIDNIKGRVRSTPQHYVYIDSLHLDAADGHIVLHGYFNGSDPKNIYLTSNLRMEKVNLSKLMYKFDNFGQDYLLSENVRGIMSGKVQSTAHLYPDFTVDLAKTKAHAEMSIRNGRLIRFAPMHAMSDFMGEKDLDDISFGELVNTFDVKDGYISIPSMKLTSSIGYLYISGEQNFDDKLQMDYEIRLPLSLIKEASWNMMKSKLFGSKAKNNNADALSARADLPADEELVEEEKEIIDSQKGLIRKYINVRVAGTTDNFKINLGKKKK